MRRIKTIEHYKGTFDRQLANDDGVVPMALSSERPVRRMFGNETLVHDVGSVNLERADRREGLPLLFNHNDDQVLGRVHNIRIDSDRVLRGDAHFDLEDPEGARRYSQVRRGILPDTSIRYAIDRVEDGEEDDDYRVTEWTLLEATVASVPADPDVGAGRTFNIEDLTMDETQLDDARQQGAEAERARVKALRDMHEPHMARDGIENLLKRAIDEGVDVDTAGRDLLDSLGRCPFVPGGDTRADAQPRFSAGEDQGEKFVRGATQAILHRMARPEWLDEKERSGIEQNEFASFTMLEFARHSLKINGISQRGMMPRDVIGTAFTRAIDPGGPATATTGTFPDLLENVLGKVAFASFAEAPRTWSQWCSRGSTSSFREYSRPNLSHADDLAVIAENGPYTDASFVDKKEIGQLVKAGRKYSYTLEAALADDLSELTTLGQRMGEAANRYLDVLPYTSLESGVGNNGPTMNEDGVQLFDAAHNNLDTGAAPTVASVESAAILMNKQLDPNNVKLGIIPMFIIGPVDLRFTIGKLLEAEFDPNATAGTLTPNSVRGMSLVPVITHHLTSTTAWYLAAGVGRTYEMTLLNGSDRPALERDTGWTYDAIHWKVRQQGNAFPRDFRGLVKNPGA